MPESAHRVTKAHKTLTDRGRVGIGRPRRRHLGALIPAAALLLVLPPATLASDAGGPAGAARGEVLVGYEPGAPATARDRALEHASARVQEKVFRGKPSDGPVDLVAVPAGISNSRAIAALERQPAVAFAEPNWRLQPAATSNDPFFTNGSLWGMYGNATSPANQYGSQAGEAWLAGNTGSSDVYVGVIDEGVQYTHPDLDGNAWTNPFDPVNGRDDDGNGYVDDRNGWDFYNRNNTVYDGGTKGRQDKHGTHVAGTIGAEGGNGAGVAGVNWRLRYVAAKFLGPRGGYVSDAVRAVNYLTDLKARHGLNVVASNNSWGGGGYSQALHDAVIRGAKQDILFVAAAGNSGDDNDAKASYPSKLDTSVGTSTQTAAGYDAVISVAAIDRTGALASWSNYGQATVDLGAPGVGINSTLPYNKYGAYSGTSMATPHVSGAAALYAASHPGATGHQIKSAILGSSLATPSLQGKTATGARLNAGGF